MSKLLGEIGRGYARGGVIMLGSTIIMFSLVCVLICLPLWMVEQMDAPQWILFLSGAILLLILFGSIPIVLFASYQARKKRLDNVFLPVGVTGSRYQFLFRQYHGIVNGKELSIRFYRGPVLEIEVETTFPANLVATQTRPSGLANFLGQTPLKMDDPAFEKLKIYSQDEDYARRLVQHSNVANQLLELTTPKENFVYRQVIFRSGKLILSSAFSSRLFGFDLDPDAARDWVAQVVALTSAVELIDLNNQ